MRAGLQISASQREVCVKRPIDTGYHFNFLIRHGPQSRPADVGLSLFVNGVCKFPGVRFRHSPLASRGVSGPHTLYRGSLETGFVFKIALLNLAVVQISV